MSIKSALPAFAVLALFSLLATPALANDENILGTWKLVEMEGEPAPITMTWTFDKEGVLSMTIDVGNDQPPMTMKGSYTAKDGSLTVKMSDDLGGEENTAKYVIDGKKMTVEGDEDGKVVVIKLERLE